MSLISISRCDFSCVDAWFGGGADGKTVGCRSPLVPLKNSSLKGDEDFSFSALIEGWAPSLEVQLDKPAGNGPGSSGPFGTERACCRVVFVLVKRITLLET